MENHLMAIMLIVLVSVCFKIMNHEITSIESTSRIEILMQNDIVERRAADIIKNRLHEVYHDNQLMNKRELIVHLLIQLEKIEDPSMFFEDNDHIRSYIFDMSLN